jgi:hypothetical protein
LPMALLTPTTAGTPSNISLTHHSISLALNTKELRQADLAIGFWLVINLIN